MKVLLDENFPLALLRHLQSGDVEAEHIITLGWRGATDDRIREQLIDADIVFLTQDEDFLFSPPTGAVVVVSRVRQARRIADRVDVWRSALHQLVQKPAQARRFELFDDGTLVPWEQAADGVWASSRTPL